MLHTLQRLVTQFHYHAIAQICKLCTEKSAESHWTETVHLFKDCYPNLIDIENPLNKNETDV